jgi:hypothetical protein
MDENERIIKEAEEQARLIKEEADKIIAEALEQARIIKEKEKLVDSAIEETKYLKDKERILEEALEQAHMIIDGKVDSPKKSNNPVKYAILALAVIAIGALCFYLGTTMNKEKKAVDCTKECATELDDINKAKNDILDNLQLNREINLGTYKIYISTNSNGNGNGREYVLLLVSPNYKDFDGNLIISNDWNDGFYYLIDTSVTDSSVSNGNYVIDGDKITFTQFISTDNTENAVNYFASSFGVSPQDVVQDEANFSLHLTISDTTIKSASRSFDLAIK